MKSVYKILFGCLLLSLAGPSCKKYLEVGQPRTQLSSGALFSNDATATAAQLAIYSQIESQGLLLELIVNTGLSGDEYRLQTTFPTYADLGNNNLTDNNALVLTHWMAYYKMIYQANAVLEGIARSASLTEPVKNQLRGEALLIRAFFHFYLTNMFGEIPLARSTDYAVNALLARQPVTDVYAFIEADLSESLSLLDDQYKTPSNGISSERVRPNKATAVALLARVYLYTGNWAKAAEMSTLVINNPLYELTADLNQVFLKNDAEQIWQLMAVIPGFNSFAGGQLILYGPPGLFFLDTSLVNEFRAGDNRRNAWVGSVGSGADTWYFPYKYKAGYDAVSVTEYSSVLRLSEQYLIRAEARAMLNEVNAGQDDLNMVRNRSGLPSLSGLTMQALIDSVNTERRFELFAECGDRWFNLKRSGKADEVLTLRKGADWTATDALYPIPLEERLRNISLTQNPGY